MCYSLWLRLCIEGVYCVQIHTPLQIRNTVSEAHSTKGKKPEVIKKVGGHFGSPHLLVLERVKEITANVLFQGPANRGPIFCNMY